MKKDSFAEKKKIILTSKSSMVVAQRIKQMSLELMKKNRQAYKELAYR